MMPLSDLAFFSFEGAEWVKQRTRTRTLYPAGIPHRTGATSSDRSDLEQMPTVRNNPAATDTAGADTGRRSACNAHTASGALRIGTDTAYRAGAPTIAREQPQTQAGDGRRGLCTTDLL